MRFGASNYVEIKIGPPNFSQFGRAFIFIKELNNIGNGFKNLARVFSTDFAFGTFMEILRR